MRKSDSYSSIPINNDELKMLQLDILKAVDHFCNDSGIKYSLAFGTLLGAVRHEGFIPWDDDIDIMMPREDYNKFIKSFGNERYSIADHSYNKKYVIPYAKVIDNSTILYEDSRMDEPIGVNIDVFPLDACPPQNEERNWYIKKRITDYIFTLRILKIDRGRNIFKNLLIIIGRLMFFMISLSKLCEWMQALATKYEGENTGRTGVIIPSNSSIRRMNPSSMYASYKKIKFENFEFNSIIEADKYLTIEYGDYMQLPPEEKRISHHGFKAYWK